MRDLYAAALAVVRRQEHVQSALFGDLIDRLADAVHLYEAECMVADVARLAGPAEPGLPKWTPAFAEAIAIIDQARSMLLEVHEPALANILADRCRRLLKAHPAPAPEKSVADPEKDPGDG